MKSKDYLKIKNFIMDEEDKVTSDGIEIGSEGVIVNGNPEMRFPVFETDGNGNRLRRIANNMPDMKRNMRRRVLK
jgi:hypothetical protein